MTPRLPPPLLEFARRLLLAETGGQSDPDNLVEATARCCEALRLQLSPLLSAAGFDALMGRALILTVRTFPFLVDARVPAGLDCSPTALRRAVDGRSAPEVADALITLLAAFIWLLIIFIGEGLGLRKIREVWPDVPFAAPAPPPETTA